MTSHDVVFDRDVENTLLSAVGPPCRPTTSVAKMSDNVGSVMCRRLKSHCTASCQYSFFTCYPFSVHALTALTHKTVTMSTTRTNSRKLNTNSTSFLPIYHQGLCIAERLLKRSERRRPCSVVYFLMLSELLQKKLVLANGMAKSCRTSGRVSSASACLAMQLGGLMSQQ